MNTIQDQIIDLFYLNNSIEQIADLLLKEQDLFMISDSTSQVRVELIKFIEKTLKNHQDELEADAYLSSMECYYDNYCEY